MFFYCIELKMWFLNVFGGNFDGFEIWMFFDLRNVFVGYDNNWL